MTANSIKNNDIPYKLERFAAFSLNVSVLRLDENDSEISGNKFYKLQPWLQDALRTGRGLLSCGGAYSNHLHALAAAGKRYGIKTAGLVRGLEQGNLTYTMKDCCEMGMELIAVSRQEYSNRYQAGFAEKYLRQFQKSIQQPIQHPMIWVPEGGTETKAVEACEQIGFEINHLADNYAFDALWIAVGSGGTLAGIARSLNPSIQIRAVPVMKNYLTVKQRLSGYLNQQQSARITWVENGWYQGFGRFKQADVKRLLELEKQTGVPLDPVYTAKVMRRMIEAIQKNEFSDSRPLFLHTGGLQGRRSISNDE